MENMQSTLALSARRLTAWRPSPPRLSAMAGVWLAAVLLAVLCGMALAVELYPVLLLLCALIAGPVLLFYPRLGVWAVSIGALCVAGLVDLYLPALSPVKWGIALLAIGLPFVASIGAVFQRSTPGTQRLEQPAFLRWLLVFFLVFLVSTFGNWKGAVDALGGLKSYFQVWGLVLAFCYIAYSEREASRFMRFLPLLGLLQIPFVLHQFLVLVPMRTGLQDAMHGIVAVDIVAGTFGGSMKGGGRSSSLALLAVICFALVLARWRVGEISGKRLGLFSLAFLAPLALCEAKIIIVLIPLAVFFVFRDRILFNPVKAVAGAIAVALLVFAMFLGYSALPGAKGQRAASASEDMTESIAYNFGEKGYGNSVLNRSSVYTFWWKENAKPDTLFALLFGTGPGEANSSSLLRDDTLAAKRYAGYAIGLTGLSSMLWELGLMGTLAVLILLSSAYRQANNLAAKWKDTAHWPLLKAAEVAIVLVVVNLAHNNYFVSDISFQTLLMLVLGYLVAMTHIKRGLP